MGDEGQRRDGWSAVRVPAEAVELPWGLTRSALRRVVPEADLGSTVTREHEIQGLHQVGASQILTFRGRDRGGRGWSRTVVVKRTDPSTGEAEKYRHLAAVGAPVAPLLGVLHVAAGPVIVTGILPRIGIGPGEVDELLGLSATINTITDIPEALFRARGGDPQYGRRVLDALVDLRRRVGGRVRADQWLDAYRQVSRTAAASPTALNHNELALQQVGWTATGPDAQLVMIDLATMALLPRFTDLAGLLAPLAELTGTDESALTDTYLDRLADRTGHRLHGPEIHREIIAVRLMRTFESLPWWLGPDPPPSLEPADQIAARMVDDLHRLGITTPG